MKRIVFIIAIFSLMGLKTIAQSPVNFHNGNVQYHFFINTIPSEFNYPLIGFVNNVNGNHESIQLGFVNSTSGNFGGIQVGFVNNVDGRVVGLQSGFVNNAGNDVKGIQNGFINNVDGLVSGFQSGFVNSVDGSVYGMQNGFINSTEDKLIGLQCGFINSVGTLKGVQYGFINSAETLTGVQLGFINSVDNLDKGLPIGFLSFVKNGGYKAIEIGTTGIYPVNIAFKTGIRELYTYPMLAYDWRMADDRLAFGYGIGSNIDISDKLFINPEMDWLHQVSMDFNHFTSLRCNIGLSVGESIELVAGPSLVWHFKIDSADFHQNYTEWDSSIVSVNDLKIGFNAAIRFKF